MPKQLKQGAIAIDENRHQSRLDTHVHVADFAVDFEETNQLGK
jgi:hypothetical protein